MRPQRSTGLGEDVCKLEKNKDKATFFSPTEGWVMPAPSSERPEEREFVVDSGGSVHMLSEKDSSSGELETLRKSRNPTTVVTADGDVQTIEEARENVHDLDLFVTVHLLEDTPAVLSLGKLCEEHGYTYERASSEKPQLTKSGKRVQCKKKRSDRLRENASETMESNKSPQTKHACIVEAHESTRKRLESTLPKDHEVHIAEKRFNSISHYNWSTS